MEDKDVRKSLKYSVYDGVSVAAMDGLTSSFMTPFAVALKASVGMIAALTYVPQLAGAFIQLFAAKLVEVLKDRRRILVASTFLHALLWLPLLLIPYVSPSHVYLLVAYVAAQTMLAQLISPVWNSLMGDIVPKHERGRFFGVRNRIVGITSFIAAIFAGLLLNYLSPKNPIMGFTILFALAFIARLLSALFKSHMTNPEPDLAHESKFSIIDFVRKMDKTNYGHFVIYVALFKLAVSIASPFFAVYMLKNLGFSYLQFTIITSAELVASFATMSLWGKMIDSRGTKSVIYITGMLTPFVPFFWLASSNFYYLILVQVFSGISWAGFNLSSSNFIFDAVQPENRVRCIAYFKFFEGIAIFIGAALGGIMAEHAPAFLFTSGILLAFLVSGLLRLMVSAAFLPTLREARLIELGICHSFFKRYLTIRPSEGIVFEVMGKYHRHEEQEHHEKRLEKTDRQKVPAKKDDKSKERLLKFIGKNLSQKKEQHDLTNMHDIEHITEDIEKGKVRK